VGAVRAHAGAALRIDGELDTSAGMYSAPLITTRGGFNLDLGPINLAEAAPLVLNYGALPTARARQRHVPQIETAHGFRCGVRILLTVRQGGNGPGVFNAVGRAIHHGHRVGVPKPALGAAPRNAGPNGLPRDAPAHEHDPTRLPAPGITTVRDAVQNPGARDSTLLSR